MPFLRVISFIHKVVMEEQIEQAVTFALSPTTDQSLKSQVCRPV